MQCKHQNKTKNLYNTICFVIFLMIKRKETVYLVCLTLKYTLGGSVLQQVQPLRKRAITFHCM